MKVPGNHLWRLIALAAPGVLLVFALQFFSHLPIHAAEPTTQLGFTPAVVDLTPGKTATVTVQVMNVQGLYGLQLDVLYDPQRVTIKSIAPGGFLKADFVAQRVVNSAQGIASLAYTQLSPSEPVNGSGDVAVLVLESTDCLIDTTLQLSNVILSDNNGIAISSAELDGIVQNANTGEMRKISGILFHDGNENAIQDGDDLPLANWPVFARPYRPVGAQQETAYSAANGGFQFDDLTCGTYWLWSQNGSLPTTLQRIPLLAAADVLTVSLPITGTLKYPFQRIFLPEIAKSNP